MDISLLTINVAQFPAPLGIGNRELRIVQLAHCVKYIDADVVVCQEMWSNIIREQFYAIVREKYPYMYADYSWGKFLLGMHSGLMLISKHPIVRSDILHFQHYRGPEHFAKKGVLGVELQVGNGCVCVFTTHLQAGSGGPLFEWWDQNELPTNIISGLEASEIRKFIDEFAKDLPSLLAGDFNIDVNQSPATEYENCVKALCNPRNTYEGEPHLGSTWDDNGQQSAERIDHIFALCDKITGGCLIIPTIGPMVSDHLAVLGTYHVDL